MKILREVLWPLIAVLAAFVVGGIIILLIGDNPFDAYGWLLSQFVRIAQGYRLDPALCDAADLYGAGGRGRFPLRPAEYRR